MFDFYFIVWLFIVWASFSSKWSLDVKSSGCKPDALFKLHFGLSKHTFQYAYLVTTCLLLCFVYVLFNLECLFEEGDGRCVRASWPDSIKLSILNLLLNPPLVC